MPVPVPSPPLPSSPSYQQQQQQQQQSAGSSSDLASGNLYQHLQRLHLQQQYTAAAASAPPPGISPPPSSMHLINQNPPRGSPTGFNHLLAQAAAAVASAESQQQTFTHLLQSMSQQHQRSSPPPNFPQNLHMIKEDTSDAQEVNQNEGISVTVTHSSSSPEVRSNDTQQQQQESQSRYSQNPQISITDTTGQVMPVVSSTSTVPLREVMVTDEPAAPPVVSYSTMSSGTTNIHFMDDSQLIMSAVPLNQRYPVPSPVSYATGSQQAFPGLNLANIPANDSMNSTESIERATPPTTPTLNRALPMMGLFSTSLNHSISSPLTNRIQRPNNFRQHRRHHTVQNTHDAVTQLQGSVSLPRQLQFGSYFSPTNSNSDVSSPVGDMHHSQIFKLQSPGDMTPSPTLEGMNAMNLRNSLGDMPQKLKFTRSVSLASEKDIEDIYLEIKRALDSKTEAGISYQHSENLFRLASSEVQMEMEVCQGETQNGLRFRKIAGDTIQYRKLCIELLSGMDL